MKPFLYQKLIRSLLFELAGSQYVEGDRFLSKRKIIAAWNISEPTAKSALAFLLEHELIEARPRSGYVVKADFRSQTLILLHLMQSGSLPPPQDWKARVRKLTRAPAQSRYRLGVIFDTPSLGSIKIPGLLEGTTQLVTLQCMQAFLHRAQEEGCSVEWFFRDGNAALDEAALTQIEKKKLHGIAFFRQHLHGVVDHLVRRLSERGVIPVALFDSMEHPDVTCVKFNDFGIGYEVGTRLLALQHRKLAVFAPRAGRKNFDDRVNGFYFAMEEARSKGWETEVQCCRVPTLHDAPEYLECLLKDRRKRPTAIFFSGYHLAAQSKSIFDRMKLRIPKDISLIACGRETTQDPSRPPADLFCLNMETAARTCVDQLLLRLRGEPVENMVMIDIDYRSHQAIGRARSSNDKNL